MDNRRPTYADRSLVPGSRRIDIHYGELRPLIRRGGPNLAAVSRVRRSRAASEITSKARRRDIKPAIPAGPFGIYIVSRLC